MPMPPLAIAVVTSILISVGQMLWKVGLNRNGGLVPPGGTLWSGLLSLAVSPAMVGGCAAYVAATLLWMYLVGRHPFSYVFPMFSLTFVFSLLFAVLLFKETITPVRLAGLALILWGVFLVSSRA